MLHTKFQAHQSIGSGEEGFFKGFYHIWAWQARWSRDPTRLNDFSSLNPCRLHMNFGYNWLGGFLGKVV